MQPIARYHAKRFLFDRRFELDADSIRAVGKSSQADFDVTLPLARLDPHFHRVWVVRPLFYVGYFLVVIAVVLLLALVTYVQTQDFRVPYAKAFAFLGCVGGAGLIVAFATHRKVEYATFHSDAGTAVFSVPHNGKKTEEFQQFVELLVRQIHEAKNPDGSVQVTHAETKGPLHDEL